MDKHIIYSHTLTDNLIDSVGDTHNMTNFIYTNNYISDISVVLFITICLYMFMRSRITQMAIVSSDTDVLRSVFIFIFAIPLSILLSGVTLGAIVSRHILRRRITVDWYSVILGSISMVVISHIHVLNYLIIGPLSIITLAAIMHSYIVKPNDFL